MNNKVKKTDFGAIKLRKKALWRKINFKKAEFFFFLYFGNLFVWCTLVNAIKGPPNSPAFICLFLFVELIELESRG